MDPTLYQFTPAVLLAADLENEEILELIALFARSDNPSLYSEQINVLYSKYDNSLEMRPCEIEVLSRTATFDLRTLKNFYAAIPTINYLSLIHQVIDGYQTDSNAAYYLQRFEQATNFVPDEEFVRGLLDYLNGLNTSVNETTGEEQNSQFAGVISEGDGVTSMRRHLKFMLEKIADFAPTPSYIQNFEIDTDQLPELTEPSEEELDEVTPSTLAEFLLVNDARTDALASFDILLSQNDEKDVDFLTNQIALMDADDRRKLAQLYKLNPNRIADLQNNPDLFRVYGPVNPYLDEDFLHLKTEEGIPDINVVTGGARMFSDMKIEFDPDTDEALTTWFTGVCGACSKRIAAYHYAVRMPHQSGGWLGCYCSWDCVRDFMAYLVTDENTDYDDPTLGLDPDQVNFLKIRLGLIHEYEEQMNRLGIQDRDIEDQDEE